ncbi:uncharacterized protein LOC142585012 [Dermacentor variabilis]|uniref:uncharacterized protein LOC142585012 n=1 Tax=Dermacentor variabilis TaxID=34621 RepID=UPI003F5C8402
MATTCRQKTNRRLFQDRDSKSSRSSSVDSGLWTIYSGVSATADHSTPTSAPTSSETPSLCELPAPTPPRPSRRSLPAQQTKCASQLARDPSKSPSTLKNKVIDMFRRNGGREEEELELSSTYVTGDLWTPTCRARSVQHRPLPERFPDFFRRSFRRKSYRVQNPRSHSP